MGEPQSLREGDHLKNLGLDERITLERIFKKQYGWTWTEFSWLRRETSGRLLRIR